MATTLADLLKPALRIAGITMLPGITPSSDQFGELIPECNRMLGGWNVDGHKIFTAGIAIYPLVSGKKTYTIGPGGDFNAPRPTYIKIANFLFPGTPIVRRHIHLASDEEWASIAVQDIAGAPPYILYYDGGYATPTGLASISLKGQPPDGYSLELYTPQALLAAFAATTDVVLLPPGYEDAIVTNLALKAAALYPHDSKLGPLAVQNAAKALSALITANARCPGMRSEAADLGRSSGGGYEVGIFGGGGNVKDMIWIDPIQLPDGVRSTFTFANNPLWASFSGLNQYVGQGYNVVGYRTIQFIDNAGLTIVPGAKDSVKAAISSGTVSAAVTPAANPSIEIYFVVTGTPTGTTGSDGLAVYTLNAIPTALDVFVNGVLQTPGVSYTWVGGNSFFTFLAPNIPFSGYSIVAKGTK